MILFVQIDDPVPAGLFGRLLTEWDVPFQTWRPAREALPQLARFTGIIVLGGYMGVHDAPRYPFLEHVKELMSVAHSRDLPQLDVCLGAQLLAEVLGGKVHADRNGERGCRRVQLTLEGRRDALFAGLNDEFPVFQWHNDSFWVPDNALHLAASPDCPGQALRSGRAWGVQFHPEVDAAIVDDWRVRCSAGPEVLADFRAQESALRQVAERLLGNFLRIVDGQSIRAGAG